MSESSQKRQQTSQKSSLWPTLPHMAREVIIRMTDDLDRTQEATETREIGYNGLNHLLDLTADNASTLDQLLAPYLKAAHHREKQDKASKASNDNKAERQAIRAWAKANGHDLKARGVIPRAITDAYHKANPQ